MKRTILDTVLLSILTVGGTLQAGTPVVLLQDNFDASTATTDLNVGLERQTGVYAPIGYRMGGGPGNYGHQLQNGNAQNQLLLADFPQSTSALNFDFGGAHSAGGLQISFDLDSMPAVYGPQDSGNWGCINLGMGAADQLANVNQGVEHFGILFRASGLIQAFDGGTTVSPSPDVVYSTELPGTTNHIDIIITDTDGNPFDGSGDTVIDVYANGSVAPVWSYTKVGGYAHNFINVQGSYRAHLDNLTVTQLDPPSLPPSPWSYSMWNSDATSGISDAYNYTHAYHFGGSGNATINGIHFTGKSGANPSAAGSFTIGGMGSVFSPDNGSAVTGAGNFLAHDFIYGGNPGIIEIDGLTPGTSYVLSLYSTAWDAPGVRRIMFGANNEYITVDQDAFGGATRNGIVIAYSYVATGSTQIIHTYPVTPGNTLHFYGLSNRETTSNARPPVITVQPHSLTVAQGLDVVFKVEATGQPAPTYQWYFNGASLGEMGTNATLTLPAVTPDYMGDYQVIVVNDSASVPSDAAKLKVGLPMDNPSFEVDAFPTYPGYISGNFPITGWTSTAPRNGINPAGSSPFADNGTIPQGKQVAFMQDESSLSTLVNGLNPGDDYYVEYYENARNCCGGTGGMIVTVDDGVNPPTTIIPLHAVTAVLTANPYRHMVSLAFPASAGSMYLTFIKTNMAAGDSTVLIDNVSVLQLPPNTPPTIFNQPQPQFAALNGTAIFNLMATGSEPLAYQWQKNGQDISGATNLGLMLTLLTLNDDADYAVVITNTAGSVTSTVAHLTVITPLAGVFNTGVDASGTPLAAGAVDPHYTITVNPDGTVPDAIAENEGFPIAPAGPWLANNAASKWIGPRPETAGAAGGAYTYAVTIDLTGRDPSDIRLVGHWASDNSGLTIAVNGVETANSNPGTFGVWTPFVLASSNATFVAGPNLIEFKVNNDTLGYTGLRVEFTATHARLSGATPPVMVVQPQSTQTAFFDTVTLTGNAIGGTPLYFQWNKDGVPMPGQNGPTLTLANISSSDTAAYTLTVTNAAGSATSTPANVCVTMTRMQGIYGTGVDDAGALLPGDVADPHYILSASGDLNYPGPDAIVVADGYPIVAGTWMLNGPSSKWIAPRGNQNDGNGGGNAATNYTYTTAFDLSGVDLSRFKLVGGWATDNLGLDILVNGVSTGLTCPGFGGLTHFSISTGFIPGYNTVDFVMTNLPPAGPTALRVELAGYITLPPQLNVTPSGANVIVSWTPANPCQQLLWAPQANGPWTPAPFASSPAVVPTTNEMRFFRVVQ